MTKDEALKKLADVEVVPCVSAGIADAKELLEACLQADIPAILARQECKADGHSCAPRFDLCVRQEDLPTVMDLMHARWQALLDQEGTLPDGVAAGTEDENPPCPACGTVGPLVDGACKECGLQLEHDV